MSDTRDKIGDSVPVSGEAETVPAMVKKVAGAICAKLGSNPAFWEMHEEVARAAIVAMREPTEGMFCAGDEKIVDALNSPGLDFRHGTPAQHCFRAMIDAALAQ